MENDLKSIVKGKILTDQESLKAVAHDASIFEVIPTVVVVPEDVDDIKNIVSYVNDHKAQNPGLSVTARGGGTDMSGGPLSDSIVVDMSQLKEIGDVKGTQITSQLGAYYRDLEKITLDNKMLMPAFPASKNLCTIGGMVADNAGGEKSLRYGKTDRYVTALNAVMADGELHTFAPLKGPALQQKLAEKGLEGDIYRSVYELVTVNKELITKSKPVVSKNSTGYNIWDVWDGETLDLTKLLVGSQGTLGILTETTLNLVPTQPLSGMIVGYLSTTERLGEIVNAILPLEPSSLESFDDHTLKFALRFFPTFRDLLGWPKFLRLAIGFAPVLVKLTRFWPGLPKLVLLIEFEGDNADEIAKKVAVAEEKLSSFGIKTQEAKDQQHSEKFWLVRRESFSLLRKNLKKQRAVPFIDDVVVPPACLPQFWPRLIQILESHKIMFTVAGHVGEGNFHIIPLMDLTDKVELAKVQPVLKEVNELVLGYGGSLSGEHNDGLIRGPWLEKAYSSEVMSIFKDIKKIFDPQNIFNPHKKTDATEEYTWSHLKKY